MSGNEDKKNDLPIQAPVPLKRSPAIPDLTNPPELLFGAPLYEATPEEEVAFKKQMDKANAEYEKRRQRMPSGSLRPAAGNNK